jgi:hypothetical protein
MAASPLGLGDDILVISLHGYGYMYSLLNLDPSAGAHDSTDDLVACVQPVSLNYSRPLSILGEDFGDCYCQKGRVPVEYGGRGRCQDFVEVFWCGSQIAKTRLCTCCSAGVRQA